MDAAHLQSCGEAVQDYLDELLCDAPMPRQPVEVSPQPAIDESSYLLVRAAGIRLALPALKVREAHPGDGARTLDVGALVRGKVLAGSVTGIGLVVEGCQDWVLTVDGLEGIETIRPECIEWRDTRGSRPWLAGMASELQVAILVPEEIIAEARRNGI